MEKWGEKGRKRDKMTRWGCSETLSMSTPFFQSELITALPPTLLPSPFNAEE